MVIEHEKAIISVSRFGLSGVSTCSRIPGQVCTRLADQRQDHRVYLKPKARYQVWHGYRYADLQHRLIGVQHDRHTARHHGRQVGYGHRRHQGRQG